MKTLSKLDLERVAKRAFRVEGSQRWSMHFEVGREGRRSNRESGSKVKLGRVDRILLYDSASLTLCCKVLPRLTVMSYSTDYNINSKPRCLGFEKASGFMLILQTLFNP